MDSPWRVIYAVWNGLQVDSRVTYEFTRHVRMRVSAWVSLLCTRSRYQQYNKRAVWCFLLHYMKKRCYCMWTLQHSTCVRTIALKQYQKSFHDHTQYMVQPRTNLYWQLLNAVLQNITFVLRHHEMIGFNTVKMDVMTKIVIVGNYTVFIWHV